MKKIFIYIALILMVSPALSTDLSQQQKVNLLNRIGYGATEKSLLELNNESYEKWIHQQIYQLKNDQDSENKFNFPKNNEEMFFYYKKYDFFYNEIYLQKKLTKEFYQDTIYKSLNKRIYYAMNSENRIREMMVWFWYNHFNTGPYTNTTPAIFLNDYEDKIRKLSLGNFKDLLSMIVHHPAMLVYLNNNSNQKPMKENASVGLNENYAREFLELHTMGVGTGYTQQDVQELARILSGFSALSFEDNEDDLKNIKSYKDFVKYTQKNILGKTRIENYFIYQDKLHFDGDKVFLGNKIKNSGEKEIISVFEILIKDKRVAEFISKKLAIYFLNDNPDKKIINDMSQKFLETKGDISKTLEVLFLSKQFVNSLNTPIKVKDTYTYMLSTMKTGLKGKPWDNQETLNEVTQLLLSIEASPYSHNTPEGLSVYGKDWLSSSRLQEYFYYNNLIFRNRIFENYKINYNFINQTFSQNLKTPEDTIQFFTSEQWIKR